MAFGGPMPGGPGMAPPAPPMPPPGPPDPETIRIASSPTWDDVLAVLRSDQMRGYRIDIETDATVLQDAEADKQSRIEFTKAAGEMLQQAYQAMTVAPQMLPVIKELFMFSIRGFHAGRSMEETFEDAFDEMAQNMPKAPGPAGPDPAVMGKLEIEKQRLLLDSQRMEKDSQAKANETMAQQNERTMRLQLDAQRLEADKAKVASDAQLKNKELDIQAQSKQADLSLKADGQQKDIMLRAAAHNKSLVDEATAEASGQAPDGARSGPTHLEQLMTQLAQVVVQGHESLAQAQNQLTQAFMQAQKDNAAALSQSHQMHAAQMADLGKRLTAPRKVIRGPDGRAMGVETVG